MMVMEAKIDLEEGEIYINDIYPAITASSGLYHHEGAQYARQNSRGEEISHEQRRNDDCQKQNIVLPANQLLNLFSRNPVSG
mgnify:CR=1 FL=1